MLDCCLYNFVLPFSIIQAITFSLSICTTIHGSSDCILSIVNTLIYCTSCLVNRQAELYTVYVKMLCECCVFHAGREGYWWLLEGAGSFFVMLLVHIALLLHAYYSHFFPSLVTLQIPKKLFIYQYGMI